MMAGQSDDAMISLLKNKINSLETQLEEKERKYEQQIHSLKVKYNEAQKESNTLALRIRDLEKKLDEVRGSQTDGTSAEIDRKVRQLQDQLAEKDETLIRLANENITLDTKYNELKLTLSGMKNSQDGLSEREDESIRNDGDGPRKILRKRRISQTSRPDSRHEKTLISPSLVNNLQGDEELKRMLNEVLEEKARLEKINSELSNKVMTLVNHYEEEKRKEIMAEKKKSEILNMNLKRELDEVKRQREDYEKTLLAKIISLERKLEERDEQMKVLGSGIESLKKDLQMKEDPAHNSVQLMKYLEKFSKYQNEFMQQEVKRFQDDFVRFKKDLSSKEIEHQASKSREIDMNSKFLELQSDLQLKKEVLDIKEEEIIGLKQENNNLTTAMEMLRKEKLQINNLKKMNNEMVVLYDQKNQLIHYKALVRRMNANSSMSNNVSLVGVQNDMMLDDDKGDPKNATANHSRVYGFDSLRKEFEDALNENARIEALKNVASR